VSTGENPFGANKMPFGQEKGAGKRKGLLEAGPVGDFKKEPENRKKNRRKNETDSEKGQKEQIYGGTKTGRPTNLTVGKRKPKKNTGSSTLLGQWKHTGGVPGIKNRPTCPAGGEGGYGEGGSV